MNKFERWAEAHHYALLVVLLVILAASAVGVNWMAYEQRRANSIGQSIYEGPASHSEGAL